MKQILIADRDPSVRATLYLLLQEAGYRVIAANGASETLRIVSETRCDLIILEISKADADGFITVKRLKEQTPDVFIIAITGGSSADYKPWLAAAHRSGVDCVIPKPFSSEQLLSSVQKVLEASE
jgi:CheY-like chemotaxis protein